MEEECQAALLKGGGPQASPRTQKKSFSKVLIEEQKDGDIQIKSPRTYRGEPAISFSNEEITTLAQTYKYAMVGKFSRRFPEFKFIKPALEKLGFRGCFTVGALKPGFILINFELEEDFNRLWLKPEWQIGGWPMRVFKWSPNFNYQAESTMAAVWITFPDLPVHFFNKRVLFSVANLIGKPVKVDEPTADRTRPSRARVCVEIDLLKEYGSRIWIECGSSGWLPQSYFFENKPSYCSNCLKRGHSNEECRRIIQSDNGKKPEYDESKIGEKLEKISMRLQKQREEGSSSGLKDPLFQQKQNSQAKVSKSPAISNDVLQRQNFTSTETNLQKGSHSLSQHGIAVQIGHFDNQLQSIVSKENKGVSRNYQTLATITEDFLEENEGKEPETEKGKNVCSVINQSHKKKFFAAQEREKLSGEDKKDFLEGNRKPLEADILIGKIENSSLKSKETVATSQINFEPDQNKVASGQNNRNGGQNYCDAGQNSADLDQLNSGKKKNLAIKTMDHSTPNKPESIPEEAEGSSGTMKASALNDKSNPQQQVNTERSKEGKKVIRLLKFPETRENGKNKQEFQNSLNCNSVGTSKNNMESQMNQQAADHLGVSQKEKGNDLQFITRQKEDEFMLLKVQENQEDSEVPSNSLITSSPDECSKSNTEDKMEQPTAEHVRTIPHNTERALHTLNQKQESENQLLEIRLNEEDFPLNSLQVQDEHSESSDRLLNFIQKKNKSSSSSMEARKTKIKNQNGKGKKGTDILKVKYPFKLRNAQKQASKSSKRR